MNPSIAANNIEREIADLIAAYPELAEDDALRLDVIEGETGALELLDRFLSAEREADAQMKAIKARVDALGARKDAAERRKEAYRKLMFRVMQAGNLRKVPLAEATLSVRATPPSAVVFYEESIPDEFWRVKREIDKAKLAEALKSGQAVPGAGLTNGSETLAVRA